MKIIPTKYEEQTMICVENNANMKVNLFTLGASVYSLKINNKHMVCSPKNLEDYYRPDMYHGKTIGAISNRVKNGLVIIDGDKYYMDPNEGENVLHGGFNCLSNQTFDYKIKKHKEFVDILFLYNKNEYLDFLPGNITYKINYRVFSNESKLVIKFSVCSDTKTCISLTNHMFFSLGENSIQNLSLKLKSNKYIEPNKEDLTPIKLCSINSPLNFNNGKKLSKDIKESYLQKSRTKGYDHCYKLESKKIELSSKKYKLTINTDFDYAQIYTDNYEDNVEMLGTTKTVNRSVAIEPQDNLLKRPVLKRYSRIIEYSFESITTK